MQKLVRDSTGREIMEGDLLRSPHFRDGERNVYLYHVVRESDGHLEMVPINYEPKNGGKCWLLDSVGRNATIIDSRLRGENLEAWYERPMVRPQEDGK